MPKIQQGGILDIAQPLDVEQGDARLPELRRADPGRPRDASADGQRVRVCSHCGEQLEAKAMTQPPARALPDEVVPALQKQFELRQPDAGAAPRQDRRQHRSRRGATNAKAVDAAVGDLALITGQKPIVTRAKRSIAQFRLRTGNPIGAKVTLRGERMWDFLERLTHARPAPHPRLPRRARPKSFDGRGNYSLGLREQLAFPEIDYDKVDRLRGLEISIVTTAKTDEESKRLLELLGMPFAG